MMGAGLLLAATLLFPVARASAQTQTAPAFLLNRFTPATPGSDWFVLESLDFRGNLRPGLRIGFDWSQKPFVYEDRSREGIGFIVERQMYLHLGLSLNLVDRIRLAVDLPVAVHQKGGDSPAIGDIVYRGPEDTAVGDVRATLDLRLWGQYGDPFVLAIGSHVFVPTVRRNYNSDGIVRVLPRLMAAGDAGVFAYALTVGFHSRDKIADEWFQGYGIGHELFGGLALGVKPVPSVLLGAELVAYSKADDDFGKKRRTPAEVLFGARFVIAEQFRVAAGAGPGITPSKGSPEVRFLARLEWFPAVAPPDADGDGIVDKEDACPAVAGPRTGEPATNGCPPPPDRDRDGILDSEDACPDDPGVKSDTPATNGCPAPRDRDGDGVFDPADACPDNAGVKTDDPKTSGCPPPPPDADKDGVLDADDACPEKAGERTDNPKTSGCPDSDGDGVRDPEDACPDVAGAADPDPKKNGCPLARVEKGQVRITEQVKFKTGSAVILPASDPLLEAVAKVLKEHPEITKVRVEGHTDNRGGKRLNQRLSTTRAAAVVRWLVKKGGIDKGRLVSAGFGMDKPLEDNATEEGRTANRRVEFHIVEPPPEASPTPAPPKPGGEPAPPAQ